MELPVNYNNLHWTERRKVREEYIHRQNGKCYYCGESLKEAPAKKVLDRPVSIKIFPEGFFNWPVHLHHDHDTGITIGAIHAYCNAVLWQYNGE